MRHAFALDLFLAKLQRRRALSEDDRSVLRALPFMVRSYRSNEMILRHNAAAAEVGLVVGGFVSKVRLLEEGARQIVAIHVAGDAIDIQAMLFMGADHSLSAHSATEVAWVSREALRSAIWDRPALVEALWLDTLVDGGIVREWTVNFGQRGAKERIAHFVLEMAARLDAIGHLDGDAFDFPLTQNDMAGALGLSLVHFNKSLGALRQDGYLSVRNRRFVLRNRSGLVSMSGFRSGYLYLDRSRIEGIDAHVFKLARLQLDHAASGGGTAPHQTLEASR